MNGDFHEVLRDFALEKMKEIASKELTDTDKRKAIIKKARDATHSESLDDNFSFMEATDRSKAACDAKDEREESKQREKKSSRRHHHKSSKRDGHRHKSKQKDKKHSSSSSKHKRKHKRKSSHRRKDRRKGGTRDESEKLLKNVQDSGDGLDMTSIITKKKDSESSTEVLTDESDSDGRSVSPPIHFSKDDLSGLLPSDAMQMSPMGLETVTVNEMAVKTLCDSVAGSVVSGELKQILDSEREQSAEQPVETVDRVPLTSAPAEECDGNVEERDKTSSKIELEKKGQRLRQEIEAPLRASEESQKVIEKSLPAGESNQTHMSDTTGKAVQNTERQSTVPHSEEIKAESVKNNKEDKDKGENDSKKETEGAPKVKNKQNIIKIKIKTLELPTDASVIGENDGKREEDHGPNTSEEDEEDDNDDDDDEDDGVNEKTNPSLPWRIVPEEGELSPSSASDEDEEEMTKKAVAVSQMENETKGRWDAAQKDENKQLRKRSHDEKEDGEIGTDKKKQRQEADRHEKITENKERDTVRRSVKERLGKRETSKSPERKTVRSSVVAHRDRSPRRRTRHSRSRSRTPRQYRSRSRSPYSSRYSSSRGRHYRSRSRSPPGPRRSHSPHRRSHRHRDRPSDGRDRRREWSRSPSRERRRKRERSYTPVEEIDKKKLFEIAKANAYLYQKVASGELPANTKFPQLESKVTSLAGGKTVDELTEVCKNLSKGDDEDSSDEEPVNVPVVSDEEKDSFIRHPFQVKERPQSIVMNIQNATTLPIQNSKEKLRVQFPVSSGTQHRKKEELTVTGPYGEWQPVKKPEPVSAAQASSNTSAVPTITPSPGGSLPPSSTSPSTAVNPSTAMPIVPSPVVQAAVVLPPPPVVQPAPVPVEDRVFEELPAENVSIADVVAMRLKAARQLQTNPLDIEALSTLHKAQNSLQNWVNKDNKPGLFTGRTDANILTPTQLGHPDRKNQAWAKKVRFCIRLECYLCFNVYLEVYLVQH